MVFLDVEEASTERTSEAIPLMPFLDAIEVKNVRTVRQFAHGIFSREFRQTDGAHLLLFRSIIAPLQLFVSSHQQSSAAGAVHFWQGSEAKNTSDTENRFLDTKQRDPYESVEENDGESNTRIEKN